MGNINAIATKYILSMDFKNLRKLHDKTYCNKLTEVTSKAIGNSYKERIEVMESVPGSAPPGSAPPGQKQKQKQKQEICDNLAMFYIQIAHIFAAITLTLQSEDNGKRDNLIIPEIMHLYYDDDYNPKTGQFESMTEKTRKIFEQNLTDFYIHFTGNFTKPDSIKKFSDIKMNHHVLNPLNTKNNSESVHFISNLFEKYSENLKNSLKHVKEKQQELLDILNILFINDSENDVIINPTLNEKTIQPIMINTRNIIIELHLKYEDDYNEGLKIYEAIVESLLFITLKNEIDALTKLLKYPISKKHNSSSRAKTN
jgi:hypothetical protein